MWERQIVEWKNETLQGNIGREEATQEWEQYKRDPKVKRDSEGPKHALRLSIQVGYLSRTTTTWARTTMSTSRFRKGGNSDDAAGFAQKIMAGSSTSIFAQTREGEEDGGEAARLRMRDQFESVVAAVGAGQVALNSGVLEDVNLLEMNLGKKPCTGGRSKQRGCLRGC